MKEIDVISKNGASKIFIGESISNFRKYLPHAKVVIITDRSVHKIYNQFFGHYPVIIIDEGEANKTLQTVEFIYNEFVRLEVDRNSFILAIGGGLVSDITGFAAVTFMRGLRFGFISSTLLAQVDAGIGGKNGVNFHRFKNMIGTIHQPEFVICDPNLLKTLSDKEFRNGLSEIIKYALIANNEMFEFIERHISSITNRDVQVINTLIIQSIEIKIKLVEVDENDKGVRRLLNFGHSLGHAIEKNSSLSHGEAVAIGMVFASKWSADKCYFPKHHFEKIQSMLSSLNLPISTNIPVDNLLSAIKGDKKRNNDAMDFIFLDSIGKAFIKNVSYQELESALLCFV